MELLPESSQADDWFGPFLLDDEDAVSRLQDLGIEVVDLVPTCVGMSLSLIEHDVTFTVASSSAFSTVLDAVQYADDGPCLRAMEDGATLAWTDTNTDPDPERRWHAFAAASAATGVASSLSLPLLRSGAVVGGFNLYASAVDAFDPHHHRLAVLLGGWAEGATTNADLGFTTRELARQAPQVLRESTQLAVAAGVLAGLVGCDPDAAVERLRRAAVQAAIPLSELVKGIVQVFRTPADG